MEKHKIIRVLEFMKDYCVEHDEQCIKCKCPFESSEGKCLLSDYPVQWDINIIKRNLFDKDKL